MTEDQLATLARNAKQSPCWFLNNGMRRHASLDYGHYNGVIQIASVHLVRIAAGVMSVPSASSASFLLRTSAASKDVSGAVLICGLNANIISSGNASPEG